MSALHEMPQQIQHDMYRRLRQRVRDWAASKTGAKHAYLDVVLVAPDMMHLLFRLLLDPSVRVTDKAKLAGALAYFITPIDLVAEAVVGPIGFLDDVALTAVVLSQVIQWNREAVERNWAGDQNIFALIEKVLSRAEAMLGYRVWNLIKRKARRARA